MAAIVLPAAPTLQTALGVDAALLRGAAAALIPISLFILFWAPAARPPRGWCGW